MSRSRWQAAHTYGACIDHLELPIEPIVIQLSHLAIVNVNDVFLRAGSTIDERLQQRRLQQQQRHVRVCV